MKKINKHIEIVSSTTSGLSSMIAKSRDAVHLVLAKHYSSVGVTIINTITDLEALVARKPDLVFLGMKFVPLDATLGINDQNKVWISQYLDAHAIAYTGSNQKAHQLELNKQLAKQRVLEAGLKTSPYQVIHYDQSQSIEDITLTFPLFVKPSNRGGGQGIDSASLVSNSDELAAKIQSITTTLQSDSLIEEYLPGREFSVAVLKAEHSSVLSTMPIELVADPDHRGTRILGSKVKSSNAEHVLEVVDPQIRAAVCTLAADVFYALGARDYGRIDIRLDDAGVAYFLEANLLPSLISGYGSFPKACELNAQLGYEAMILSIVRLAFDRGSSDIDEAVEIAGSVLLVAPVLG
jgi:D-alanine-D-alanine ligase